MQHPSKIRIIEPLITFLILGVAAIYLINVLNTGNWVWFLSTATNVRPARIVILDHGERTVLTPGLPGFSELAEASSAALSKVNNSSLIDIGLSEETLRDYATDALVLELYFDSPVRFNSQARAGEPTQLLIPIEGRHSGNGYVFLGARGEWWAGAMRMADPTPLYTALEQLGYSVALRRQPAS